jgi:hypothetical protein
MISDCLVCNKFWNVDEELFGFLEGNVKTFEEVFDALDKMSIMINSYKEHVRMKHLKGE